MILVPDVDITLMRSDQECGQNHPLDDEVGGPQQELAVLEGRRLALVGVADDVGSIGTLALVAHFAPLAEGGPAGAAHAAEVGCLELVDEPLTDGLAQRRIAGLLEAAAKRTTAA